MSHFDTLSESEQQRWTERRAMCGKHVRRHIDVETGNWIVDILRCGLWRDDFCPHCAHSRRQHNKNVVEHARFVLSMEDRDMVVITGDSTHVNTLCRKLGKGNYLRRPGQEVDTLFAPSDLVSEGEIVTYDDIHDFDWQALSNTPSGKRYSGTLGRVVRELQEGECELLIPQVVVEEVENLHQIEKEAHERMLQFIDDNLTKAVETQEEAQALVDMMTTKMCQFIVEGGGKMSSIRLSPLKRTVEISRIYTNNMKEDDEKKVPKEPEVYLSDSATMQLQQMQLQI